MLEQNRSGQPYPTILTLEALSLPNGNVDRVDAVTNASEDTGDGHLDLLGGRCLKDGANYHDPASPCNTALTSPPIGGQESDDCSKKAAQVVERSDDAFEDRVWVVEFISERWKADDGAQDSLIITEQLEERQIRTSCGRSWWSRECLVDVFLHNPTRGESMKSMSSKQWGTTSPTHQES